MSDDEYFREENPEEKPEDPPEINWDVDDDDGGDGGDDGGGGQGGGGQGGGGNADWEYGEGGGGDDDETDWGVNPDHKISLPYLKISASGFLLADADKRMLTGSLQCYLPPPVLIFLGSCVDKKHIDCALCKLSDPERPFSLKRDSGKMLVSGTFSWAHSGTFELLAKWQAGHYNHAEISQMRFVVFGIDLGWLTLPLTQWISVARIEIRTDFTVYVNDIKGSLKGNTEYLETEEHADN